MNSRFNSWNDETFELALESLTVGVEPSKRGALEQSAPAEELEDLETLLAAIHLGSLDRLEEPPSQLMRSLENTGLQQLQTRDVIPSVAPSPRGVSPVVAWSGWLAAVAAIAMLLLGKSAEIQADPAASRDELLASVADTVKLDWTKTEDPAAQDATGDVVWSSSSQEGYMRFVGLEPNDPSESQYQLWIFDPTRADWEARPVDGGVFDVPSSGDVVVPIEAKLAVADTALFAVTVEVPGGVVVSERERIVLTAAP